MFRAMFHVRDGLYFEKAIGAASAGYSTEEEIELFYKIRIHVTETVPFHEIKDGETVFSNRQKIVKTYEIDVHALASIMASMSVRGETVETYQQVLKFLHANPIAANPSDGTRGER